MDQMSKGSAGHGKPEATAVCPVDPAVQTWTESSMRWFTDEFGTEVLQRDVILPTAGFIPPGYSGAPDEVRAVVGKLCTLMMVDPARIKIDLFDGSAQKQEAAKLGKSRTVGHFHMRNGRAIIGLDSSETSDPLLLTAISVHELCHVRLLGERRINAQRADQERLTDLLTVFFGFGVFSTNAALRFARARRGWSIVPQGDFDDLTLNAARHNDSYNRLGYLKSQEFGYALACFCWLRHESDPAWARTLNPGPLTYLKQGLVYLARNSADGEFPTQRVVNKSAQMGKVTIRVTPAKLPGGKAIKPWSSF
jgi:hypothetical protein